MSNTNTDYIYTQIPKPRVEKHIQKQASHGVDHVVSVYLQKNPELQSSGIGESLAVAGGGLLLCATGTLWSCTGIGALCGGLGMAAGGAGMLGGGVYKYLNEDSEIEARNQDRQRWKNLGDKARGELSEYPSYMGRIPNYDTISTETQLQYKDNPLRHTKIINVSTEAQDEAYLAAQQLGTTTAGTPTGTKPQTKSETDNGDTDISISYWSLDRAEYTTQIKDKPENNGDKITDYKGINSDGEYTILKDFAPVFDNTLWHGQERTIKKRDLQRECTFTYNRNLNDEGMYERHQEIAEALSYLKIKSGEKIDTTALLRLFDLNKDGMTNEADLNTFALKYEPTEVTEDWMMMAEPEERQQILKLHGIREEFSPTHGYIYYYTDKDGKEKCFINKDLYDKETGRAKMIQDVCAHAQQVKETAKKANLDINNDGEVSKEDVQIVTAYLKGLVTTYDNVTIYGDQIFTLTGGMTHVKNDTEINIQKAMEDAKKRSQD